MQRGPGRPFQRSRLRYDSTFSLEAGYCFDHGIAYSEYLDRWNEVDRATVTAVALERADRCSMCGTAGHEWEEDPYASEAVRVSCPGCLRREVLQSDSDAGVGRGVSVRLLTRAAAASAAAELERKSAEGTLRPRLRRE